MKKRLFWILVLGASVALAMLPAQAASVSPVLVSGNSNCASVGSTGTQASVVAPTQNVTLNVAGGQIFVTNVQRKGFDFSTAGVVVVDVVVKGSGSNWYHYSPATAGDQNLIIPNGNKLNNVHFCYTAAPNNPPVAADDSATVVAPATVDIDVLANDTDADGDPLTIANLTATAEGGSAAVMSGKVRYTPPSGFSGEDTFTYQADDGEDLSNAATVTVTVFAGELTCNDTNSDVPVNEGDVTGYFNRLENTNGSTCEPKPYFIDVEATEDGDTVTFIPVDIDEENPQSAAYEAELTFGSNSSSNPFTRTLEYDPEDDGTFVAMPWCTGDPYDGDTIDPNNIPGSGDRWCIVSSFTEVVSATDTETTWAVVGLGDPAIRGR